jgi:RimJ/RimL family protein N-acetyltransferase
VLPEHRGNSVARVLAGLEWMRANTPAMVISTYVPRGNFAAAALAKACGFQKVGIVPKSIVRKGIAVDQTLYAMELRKCPSQQ